jgi:TPP-dependent indolepyruvate ferredoxin oxidoreductase alpha subunit
MTGGQPVDGITSVPLIAQQMAAEGVKRIALVTEDLSRYEDRSACRNWSPSTTASTWTTSSASCANCRA